MSQNETSGTVAVDNQKIRTKQMVLIALMTAVTCVLGPLSIPLPFSPVPISLTNFAIFLAIFVLGMKSGTISFIIYLLLGAVGVGLLLFPWRFPGSRRTNRRISDRIHLPRTDHGICTRSL